MRKFAFPVGRQAQHELFLILGERLGVLVVDAEEEGGDGVLLADGKEDARTKEMCGEKKEAHYELCALT